MSENPNCKCFKCKKSFLVSQSNVFHIVVPPSDEKETISEVKINFLCDECWDVITNLLIISSDDRTFNA